MHKSNGNTGSLADSARQLARTIEADPQYSESAHEVARRVLSERYSDELGRRLIELALFERNPIMKEIYDLTRTPIEGNFASDALVQMQNIMADEEARLFSNSVTIFANALKALLPHVPPRFRRVKVRMMKGDLAANAESQKVQCLGYRIRVNPNLHLLFSDSVELVFSRTSQWPVL
jgi:hypothetical protein